MNLSDPILVALDLKPGFERVVEEAKRVSAATGAPLTLLHAVPVPTMPEFGDDMEGDRDRAEARLRQLAGELAKAGVPVSTDPVTAVQAPRDLILETARSRATSLVLLGDGGKLRLDRLLSGANTEPVLRDSPRPVWVVRPRKTTEVKRLLVAVDTSRVAGEAFELAAALAKLLGARLDLLRVFPEAQSPLAPVEAQLEALRSYASRFDLEGLDLEYLAWEGEPGKRIVEATTARQSDLLVLGSAGRRGIYRWLQRPMAEQVVRQLPCSLLCVPAGT